MQWIDFPDDRFSVNGLAWWEETRPRLIRLPERYRKRVPEQVWNMAQFPSGGRIRFNTNTTRLAVRAHFDDLRQMYNVPQTGQLGIDLWVDGEFWAPVIPLDKHDLEGTFFVDLPAQRRELCLYLGLYARMELQAIGLGDDAWIEPPAPFAIERPVVYYGSSITQGGCASRAGLSYPAMIGRRLNADFVDLGFSSSGRGEPELAEAVAEIDASCYVIDFCQNCPTLDELEERYAPFLASIRAAHPDTPIICITTIFSTQEVLRADAPQPGMRKIIRAAVAERQAQGDDNIHLVEGYDLLGPDDREGLVDTVHPNDIGFMRMADGLEPHLRRVLGL